MRYGLTVLLPAILVYSCSGGGTAEKKEVSGKNIYDGNCVSCHGDDGKKGLMGAKDLTLTTMDENTCFEIIKNGKGTMTPFKALLNEEEIRAVAKYVKTLK